jgi:EAL domain-containing protein (putative c-di-GMP-specific phosphodiesterase class I)
MGVIVLPDEADIAAALQHAVQRRELEMVYQPKISLRTGDLSGVEALMRWQSPEFGLVAPSTFIPIAERSGDIDELSDWGLRSALTQWIVWQEQGLKTNIAFNISALTLRDLHFPDHLQRLCQMQGVPCGQVTVEVTEGATQHAIRLLDTITRFRIKGVSVEIDDFGTGYSSLIQLRQLPYTGLKIDIVFVKDVANDPDARLIVKSVIDLAHGLGLTATAEGVEDDETLAVLRELDCDIAQGFLISDPLKAAELAPWVLSHVREWRRKLGRTAPEPVRRMAPAY